MRRQFSGGTGISPAPEAGWKPALPGYDALTIPLRLLDAAVSYRETRDQCVLLRLPMEERKVLEQILGEDSSETV
jgi:hypothetical protein